ncbi:MAG: hypothetical protein A3C88_00820 [Candidatus Yanofskybacteria bacterium RIFCSPHIGHO2_02_FULL_50_12]|uniref:Uncharacterized protein n=1 Tax=Candidatus Yanofskybacteria bacterium RIFCSPHIGHO2_02_FULL_50_12 TaxID=1802685 RepID=A0A1F8FT15_9BACT|nr:MAG: hypothetical protein A3C88_00820 [Candidatus Yanofskybacteria bacterium RIFCSPHIGHO2_02_FULL_50_12]
MEQGSARAQIEKLGSDFLKHLTLCKSITIDASLLRRRLGLLEQMGALGWDSSIPKVLGVLDEAGDLGCQMILLGFLDRRLIDPNLTACQLGNRLGDLYEEYHGDIIDDIEQARVLRKRRQ